jgi:transcription elongation factor Elf1
MSEFFKPDCPVCGRAMGRIERLERPATRAKRTCPVCRRRFLFTITWHGDRRCDVASERIDDYRKPSTNARESDHGQGEA